MEEIEVTGVEQELPGQSVSYNGTGTQDLTYKPMPRSTQEMKNLTYGKPKEDLDLDWLYTPGAMQIGHVRQFVNLQTEENERFAAQVIMDPEKMPVLEGMRKPTIEEFTNSSEQERTAMRRDFFRTQTSAIEYVTKMSADLKNSVWDNGIKVIAREGVREFNSILMKAGAMIPDKDSTPDKGGTDRIYRGGVIPKAFEDLVRTTSMQEGTSHSATLHGYNSGYDVTLGYGAYDPPEFNSKQKSITDLTIEQVFQLQEKILTHPDNKLDSTAVGKWQMTRTNMRDLMTRSEQTGLDVKPTDKFTPEVQDKFFMASLKKRGVDDFLAGNITKDKFMAELRAEWQGLHKVKGKDLLAIIDSLQGKRNEV